MQNNYIIHFLLYSFLINKINKTKEIYNKIIEQKKYLWSFFYDVFNKNNIFSWSIYYHGNEKTLNCYINRIYLKNIYV